MELTRGGLSMVVAAWLVTGCADSVGVEDRDPPGSGSLDGATPVATPDGQNACETSRPLDSCSLPQPDQLQMNFLGEHVDAFEPSTRAEHMTAAYWASLPWRRPGVARGESSYHRPDAVVLPGRFLPEDGNRDHSNYLRIDDGEGVIFDASGPGVVERLWITGADFILASQRLRFYFDGSPTPSIDESVADFFSGGVSPFLAPYVAGRELSSGGYASYAPIPFRSRLTITTTNPPADLFFYNVAYRSLTGDTVLRTFNPHAELPELQALFAAAGLDPSSGLARATQTRSVPSFALAAGATRELYSLSVTQPSAIQFIEARFPRARDTGDPEWQAFVETWIHVFWDDEPEPSISAPLGYFFGLGGDVAEVRALAFGFDRNGRAYFALPMPFASRARIVLENRSAVSLTVADPRLTMAPLSASGDDLSVVKRLASRHTRTTTVTGQALSLLERQGDGHIVGVVMSYADRERDVILEGDELIYIDDELRFHGTGMEDFFNAAWYFERGAFSLPTHGHAGGSAYRLMIVDPINYERSVRLLLEHGPFNDTSGRAVAYQVFWYEGTLTVDRCASHRIAIGAVHAKESLEGWEAQRAFDLDASTPYSSARLASEINDRGVFVAGWHERDGDLRPFKIDRVVLRPRMYQGRIQSFPKEYAFGISSPANDAWVTTTHTDQPGAGGVVLPLAGQETYGVVLYPLRLGTDDFGYNYLQLGEIEVYGRGAECR